MESCTVPYSDFLFLDDLQRRLQWLQYELSRGFRAPDHIGEMSRLVFGSGVVSVSRASQVTRLRRLSRGSEYGDGLFIRATGRGKRLVVLSEVESWRAAINGHRIATADGQPPTLLKRIIHYEGSSEPGSGYDDIDTAAYILRKPPNGIPEDIHSGYVEMPDAVRHRLENYRWEKPTRAGRQWQAEHGSEESAAEEKPARLLTRIRNSVTRFLIGTPIKRQVHARSRAHHSPTPSPRSHPARLSRGGDTASGQQHVTDLLAASPRTQPVDASHVHCKSSSAGGVYHLRPISPVSPLEISQPTSPRGSSNGGIHHLRPISPVSPLEISQATSPRGSSSVGISSLRSITPISPLELSQPTSARTSSSGNAEPMGTGSSRHQRAASSSYRVIDDDGSADATHAGPSRPPVPPHNPSVIQIPPFPPFSNRPKPEIIYTRYPQVGIARFPPPLENDAAETGADSIPAGGVDGTLSDCSGPSNDEAAGVNQTAAVASSSDSVEPPNVENVSLPVVVHPEDVDTTLSDAPVPAHTQVSSPAPDVSQSHAPDIGRTRLAAMNPDRSELPTAEHPPFQGVDLARRASPPASSSSSRVEQPTAERPSLQGVEPAPRTSLATSSRSRSEQQAAERPSFQGVDPSQDARLSLGGDTVAERPSGSFVLPWDTNQSNSMAPSTLADSDSDRPLVPPAGPVQGGEAAPSLQLPNQEQSSSHGGLSQQQDAQCQDTQHEEAQPANAQHINALPPSHDTNPTNPVPLCSGGLPPPTRKRNKILSKFRKVVRKLRGTRS